LKVLRVLDTGRVKDRNGCVHGAQSFGGASHFIYFTSSLMAMPVGTSILPIFSEGKTEAQRV
jgi:hypothetical protein